MPPTPLARVRLAITLALAFYGIPCLLHPEHWRWLDGVDLLIHEPGHLVFAPFGDFLQFAGGTIAQLLMPAAFVVYFWRQGARHSASVALWWVAQNLWNISVYAADARAQLLPLVGGGEHDWNYLLGRLGLLPHDHAIAAGIRALGGVVFAVSIGLGVRYAGAREAEGRDATDAEQASRPRPPDQFRGIR